MSLVDDYVSTIKPKIEQTVKDALSTVIPDVIINHLIISAGEGVYDAYHSPAKHPYRRRMTFIKEDNYKPEPGGMSLTITSTASPAGIAAGNLTDLVEGGGPYDWEESEMGRNPYPRPFMEEGLNDSLGEVEEILQYVVGTI